MESDELEHLGVSLRPAYTSWPELRDYGLLVDELGYDSLWTSDHFMGSRDDLDAPTFECWQVLATWGALTRQTRVGPLVSGNTYRHPAVLANMAVTLDHITGGRAILGMGAAWFAAEHEAYGIRYGTVAQRLDWLEEAAAVVRSLLDQPRTTLSGAHYRLTDAPCEPKPVQPRLPIMLGGGGERRTLRIVARYADLWNCFGSPETLVHKIAVLHRHCAEVGRDPTEILPTVSLVVVVRDSRALVESRRAEAQAANPGEDIELDVAGSPDEVADFLARYWLVGVRGFVVDVPAPFDAETLDRLIREVRPALRGRIEHIGQDVG